MTLIKVNVVSSHLVNLCEHVLTLISLSFSAQAFPCISTGIYGKLNLSYFVSLIVYLTLCFLLYVHVL